MSRLVEYRQRAGFTQNELALAAGLTQGAITHLESGRTKSPEIITLRNIVSALNERGVECSVDDIFPPDQHQAA